MPKADQDGYRPVGQVSFSQLAYVPPRSVAKMIKPEIKPGAVRDTAPIGTVLTGYDEQHLATYLRLLDADADGADWQEVSRIVGRLRSQDRRAVLDGLQAFAAADDAPDPDWSSGWRSPANALATAADGTDGR